MPPAVKSFVPTFTTVSEFDPGEAFLLLLYGPSGAGKTQFAGSAGYEGRALFINIGGGAVTLKNPKFREKYPLAANMFITTITEEVNPKIAEAYDKTGKTIEWFFNNKFEEFDTVIVDDVTALRRFAMSKGLELNQKGGKSQTKDNFASSDVALPTVQDFGAEMALTEAFIIELVQLCRSGGKNLIMTAHERITYGKPAIIGGEAPVVKTTPGFTGRAFPDAVTGLFDCTWYIEPVGAGEGTKYRIRTVGSESLTCNTKWGGIFKTSEDNLDFPAVLKRIKGSLK